jgi:FKBP-type peptidyl-prolyl cis-trans isomerase FkpA
MKRSALVLLLSTLAACNQAPAGSGASASASPAAAQSDDEKAAYAAGFMLGRQLAQLSPNPAELAAAQKGLGDAATGKPAVHALETYGPKIQAMIRARGAARAQGEKDKGKAFREQAAKESGAVVTPTGLVIRTLTAGSGASPKASDVVKVHYRGTLIDGTEFDSSYKRGQPAEFQLTGVVPCWTEGVQKMKVGEKAKLVCPSEIAYGDGGSPPNIPGGATLVFEVELLGISGK